MGNFTNVSKLAIDDSGAVVLTLASDGKLQFRDTGIYAYSSGDGVLELHSDGDIRLHPLAGKLRMEGVPTRYRLVWIAGQRGKPGINADIQNASEAVRMIADPDFEVQGTNGASALSTFSAEGGITFTTDTGANDQMVLVPHQDANQSAWGTVTWGTDKSVRWECDITIGGTITGMIVWAGLKLTLDPTVATDNDQAFFRYQNGVNSGKWQAVSSIDGTDDAHDAGVTVVASTRYHLVVEIDSSRIAKFYINGTLVETSAALKDATDLVPFIGVQATGAGAARAITLHSQAISRTIG